MTLGPLSFEPPGDRLLAWKQVKEVAGISRTTAWRLQNAGEFPRAVVISKGRVGWRESEVAPWKAALTPRGATTKASKPPPATSSARREPSPPSATPRGRTKRRRPAVASNQISFEF